MTSRIAHKFEEKSRTGDVVITENVDFAGLLLSEKVLNGLKNGGFTRPSPIQLKAIPLGRCGLDLIVQAKSGTGKTCVFTVIALEGIQCESAATQVLVLAPTREIAVQIYDVVKTIGSAIPALEVATFIGGMPLHEDKVKLKRCHVAVGTPGRIKQLIERNILNTGNIRLFVLDEADKLLEESFQEQINWIYSTLPDNKQMLALSATYPTYLAEHLTKYMRNPTFIRLNVADPALLGIKQYYAKVPFSPSPVQLFEQKAGMVSSLLASVSFHQCLIFSNLQTMAQNLSDLLNNEGWPTTCIAGCLEQKDRLEAMEKLKSYKCRVLISTDLTARGIDAERVNMVINLDVPRDHETYLHRIGRAGRFGSFGAAVTIVSTGQEESDLKTVEHKCKTNIKTLPDPIPSDLLKSDPMLLSDVVSTEQVITSDVGNISNSQLLDNSGNIEQHADNCSTFEKKSQIGSDGAENYVKKELQEKNTLVENRLDTVNTENHIEHRTKKNFTQITDSVTPTQNGLLSSDSHIECTCSNKGVDDCKICAQTSVITKNDNFHEQEPVLFMKSEGEGSVVRNSDSMYEQPTKVESVSIVPSGCKYKVEHKSVLQIESPSHHCQDSDSIDRSFSLNVDNALCTESSDEISGDAQSLKTLQKTEKCSTKMPRREKRGHPRSMMYWVDQLKEKDDEETENVTVGNSSNTLQSANISECMNESISQELHSTNEQISQNIQTNEIEKSTSDGSIPNVCSRTDSSLKLMSQHKPLELMSYETSAPVSCTIKELPIKDCDKNIVDITPSGSTGRKSSIEDAASNNSTEFDAGEVLSSTESPAEFCTYNSSDIDTHSTGGPHASCETRSILQQGNSKSAKSNTGECERETMRIADDNTLSNNRDNENVKESENVVDDSNRRALVYNDLDIFDSSFKEIESPVCKKFNKNKNKYSGKKKEVKKSGNTSQDYDDMLKEYAKERKGDLQEADNVQDSLRDVPAEKSTTKRKIIKASRSGVKIDTKTKEDTTDTKIGENVSSDSCMNTDKTHVTSVEHDRPISVSNDDNLLLSLPHVSLGVKPLTTTHKYSDVLEDYQKFMSDTSQLQHMSVEMADFAKIVCPKHLRDKTYDENVKTRVQQIIRSSYNQYFDREKCDEVGEGADHEAVTLSRDENPTVPNISEGRAEKQSNEEKITSRTLPASADAGNVRDEKSDITRSESEYNVSDTLEIPQPAYDARTAVEISKAVRPCCVPEKDKKIASSQGHGYAKMHERVKYQNKEKIADEIMGKHSLPSVTDASTNTDEQLLVSWINQYKIKNLSVKSGGLKIKVVDENMMEPLTIDTNVCSCSDDSLCSITPDAVEYDEFSYAGDKECPTLRPTDDFSAKQYELKQKKSVCKKEKKRLDENKNFGLTSTGIVDCCEKGRNKVKKNRRLDHTGPQKQPPDKSCKQSSQQSSKTAKNMVYDFSHMEFPASTNFYNTYPHHVFHDQSYYQAKDCRLWQNSRQRFRGYSSPNRWAEWWKKYEEFYIQYCDYYHMLTAGSTSPDDVVENSQQTYNMQRKYVSMMRN